MKFQIIALGAALLFTAPLQAQETAKFLEIGKTYEIRLAKDEKVAEALASTGRAKILEVGGGGWYRVEYAAARQAGLNLPSTKAEAMGSAEVWLNFAHVVTVKALGR